MRWFSRLFKNKEASPTSPSPKSLCVATKCGHETKPKGKVIAFGDSTMTEMPTNDVGSTDYCLECIGNMAIRCAWCGGVIFIGDPITLYTPKSENDFEPSRQLELPFVADSELGFNRPKHAIIFNRKPLQLVGCLRRTCADTGADRAGFWVPGEDGKGTVHRVKTAFEEIMSGADMVVSEDLSDSSKAVPMKNGDQIIPTVRIVG